MWTDYSDVDKHKYCWNKFFSKMVKVAQCNDPQTSCSMLCI